MEPSSGSGASAQLVGQQHASQEEATNSLAPKATGTGVFMPLTMRTVSSNGSNDRSLNRSKPTRRRNLTSPSILPNCHTDKEPARRSISSSNLVARHRKAPTGRNSLSNLDACLEGQGAANQAPLADVAVAMNAAAAITASACNTSGVNESTAAAAAATGLMPQVPMSRAFSTPHQANMALHPAGPLGINHPEHVQLSSPKPQQQHMLRQHTAPGQLPVITGSSSGISPQNSTTGTSGVLGDSRNADSMGLLNTRLDSAVAAAAAARPLGLGSSLPETGSTPISTEALETFFGPSALQPAELGPRSGGYITPVDSCIDVGAAVLQPLSTASGSRQSLDVATAAIPQQPCSPGQAAASASVASNAHAVGSSSDIYSQLSFNKWTGPHAPSRLAGSDSFESALTTDVAPPDTDLEQHEQQIQKRIEELLVMKQLLKLKQQHKQQQMQLQLQQLRQEQELQQMLASLQTAKDDSPFAVQRSAASWSAGATSGVAASGNSTSQPSQQQQQQCLQLQCGSNSLEQFQRETLQQQLQQLQRQQQQQVAAQAPGGGLVTHMQQDLLPRLQVERSPGSFDNTNLELQQLRQLQQELLLKQQQQLSVQHSAGSLSSANRTMLMLQPAMSAPAPCSDGMVGFGSRPGPAATGILNDLSGLDSLNAQSFDGVLPMLYNSTSNLGSNSAACNGGSGVSPSNVQLPLTTLHDGRGRGSNMGQASTACSGGAQENAAGWGTANGQMAMNSSTGGVPGFQLF